MTFSFTCPFCYERFSRDEIQFRCENPDAPGCREDDRELAHYFGGSNFYAGRVIENKTWNETFSGKDVGGFFGKVLRLVKVPEQVRCDRCKYPSRKRICPHCHNELPTLFHEADSHIISVVGAFQSGKTHYITVLINELLQKGYLLDIQTVPQDVGEDRTQVTSKRYLEKYKKPLFVQNKELEKTQVNAKDFYPLIYQISSGQKDFGKKKALYLVFYDTAGENFEDKEELKKLANYVRNSSGIIFLLDTFQIPHIHRELKRLGVDVPNKIVAEPNTVFHSIRQLFEQFGLLKNISSKSDIPLALTFSKIDEVIKHKLYGDDFDFQEFMFQKDSVYLRSRLYTEAEIDEVSNEMRSLLHSWSEGAFVAAVERTFSHTAYFGVSALGSTPEQGLLRQNVTPHRVMDPLLWILDNLGFALPKKSKS
jgi:hypothetical protein